MGYKWIHQKMISSSGALVNAPCDAYLTSRLNIDEVFLALLKLLEGRRIGYDHLKLATRRVLRPGFVFFYVGCYRAHVDGAM